MQYNRTTGGPMSDTKSTVVYIKYPEDAALRVHLGKRKYDLLAKKARAKAMPPVVYWRIYEAERDENGEIKI